MKVTVEVILEKYMKLNVECNKSQCLAVKLLVMQENMAPLCGDFNPALTCVLGV